MVQWLRKNARGPRSFSRSMLRQAIAKIVVPATAANLGPGFDCLGMALDIYNTVSVAEAEELSLTISGEGTGTLSFGPDNLVFRGLATAYRHVGRPLPALHICCHNAIPLARGLGSSAAAVVGGHKAANVVMGQPLTLHELLR